MVATHGISQAGLLAALIPAGTKQATANQTQAAPAFVNIISLILSSAHQPAPQVILVTLQPDVTSSSTTASSSTATLITTTAASPAKIADAMIRSMLGSQLGTDSAPAPTSQPSATALAVATDPASPQLMAADDSVLANPQVSRKQLPSGPDAPTLTTTLISTAVEAPPLVSVPTAAVPSSGMGDSRTSVMPTQGSTSASTTQLAAKSPEGKVAFTAILTPMKETPVTADAQDAPREAAALPEAAGALSSTPEPPATPLPANAPTLASQTIINEEDIGSNRQPGGDAASQQQNDSPETPAPAIVMPADTKTKAAPLKQDGVPQPINATSTGDALERSIPVMSPGDQQGAAAPQPSGAIAAAATPSQATAEALRISEPNVPAVPPSRTGVAQEITIRVEQPDASPVDLRVVERSGQVHVDVRTPDAAMQTSLREDLGTLTSSLQRAGYHAETFIPSTATGRASSAQTGNQDDHQDPSQNRGGSGDTSGGRRQQQQQKRASNWLEELEDPK
jgi:hypothetical protein